MTVLFLLSALVLFYSPSLCAAGGACGFAKGGQEQTQVLDEQGPAKVVTFTGFDLQGLNQRYRERKGAEFQVQGRQTYWAPEESDMFLYWCAGYQKWRVAATMAFMDIRNGACFSYASSGVAGAELETLQQGNSAWIEVQNGAWAVNDKVNISVSIEQPEDEEQDIANDSTSQEGKAKKEWRLEDSKCPAAQAVVVVRDAAIGAGRMAIDFARQLVPALIAPPSEP